MVDEDSLAEFQKKSKMQLGALFSDAFYKANDIAFTDGWTACEKHLRATMLKAVAANNELAGILQALLGGVAEKDDEAAPAKPPGAAESSSEEALKPGQLTQCVMAAATRLNDVGSKPFAVQQITAEARQIIAPIDISDLQVRSALKSLCGQQKVERLGRDQYRVKKTAAAAAQ